MTDQATITDSGNQNQINNREYQARVYALAPVGDGTGDVTVVYTVVKVNPGTHQVTLENEGPLRTTKVSGFLAPEAYTSLTITAKTGVNAPAQILPSQLTSANLFEYFNLTPVHGTLAEYHLVGANDPTGTVRIAYTLRDQFGRYLSAQMQTVTGLKTLAQALDGVELKLVLKSDYSQQVLPKVVNQSN